MDAVIFDIDDTLLHSMSIDDQLYRLAINDVVGDVRFRESLAEYEHVSDSGILQQVLIDNSINVDVFDEIRERFLLSLESHVAEHGPFREIAGARDALDRLRRSKQHAVALATGCWRRSAELKLRTAGFSFDDMPLATADDAMERTNIMRHALGSLRGCFDSITYFGDGIWDQEACRDLGWHFRPVGPTLNGLENYCDEFRD
ncbi:MAG: HAD hydrolase-like protein [Woeseia sp.]|nr:haloacid dehalogenase-like hydrolase [Woeseia sp.]MBT8097219.1 haloacid dehalogenase-like hydrolase [Woeseia sp.]NNE60178.1 HAD hydrolase-like protein [Woeseia sp.]NNL55410.1 HAD hydrolase-like protein [Woeseia sp.]